MTGPDSFSQTYNITVSDERNVLDSITDPAGRVTAGGYRRAGHRPAGTAAVAAVTSFTSKVTPAGTVTRACSATDAVSVVV